MSFFHELFKKTYAKYLIWHYGITAIGTDYVAGEEPFVLLGNHMHNLDPFFILAYTGNLVHFVANDAYFQIPVLNRMLRFFGTIPKRKFMTDADTVRKIMTTAKENRSIGIFPEGRRTWDGVTDEINTSTAKLVKKLGMKVVTCNIRGSMLTRPRWASTSRPGKIQLEFRLIADKDELKEETVDSLHQKITHGIFHDENAWQEENKIRYRGKRLAEGLEKFLYCCPKCREIGTMKSKKDQFYCSSCDFFAVYDDFGNLNGNYPVTNTRDYQKLQIDSLREKINEGSFELKAIVLFATQKKDEKETVERPAQLIYKEGELKLMEQEEGLSFEPQKIEGSNIKGNSEWRFYYEKTSFKIRFSEGHTSAYQWYQLVRQLQSKNNWSKVGEPSGKQGKEGA